METDDIYASKLAINEIGAVICVKKLKNISRLFLTIVFVGLIIFVIGIISLLIVSIQTSTSLNGTYIQHALDGWQLFLTNIGTFFVPIGLLISIIGWAIFLKHSKKSRH